MNDFYYKSNEEYVFCNKCGYSYERILKTYGKKRRIIYKCPICGNESVPRWKDHKAKCRKCSHKFTDTMLKYAVYDIREQRGKGSYTIAGVLYKCPKCGEETVPMIKNRQHICKSCKTVFDKKTVEQMRKRKKISFVHSVCSFPERATDSEIQKFLKKAEADRDIVLIEKNILKGGKDV